MLLAPLCLALLGLQDPAPLVITGSVLLPDGEPALGVHVEFDAYRMVRRRGVSSLSTRRKASTTTDAAGAFRLAAEFPRAATASVRMRLRGYPELQWTLSETPKRGLLDLGSTRLSEPAWVTGFIQDASGELLTRGWDVRGYLQRESAGSPYFQTHRSAPDLRSGEFRLGPFSPGEVSLSATGPGGLRISKKVSIGAGQQVAVLLRHDRTDLVERASVTVVPQGATQSWYDLKEVSLTLRDATGAEVARSRAVPGSRNDFEFTRLGTGDYVVCLDDPRFLPARLEPVNRGGHYTLPLEGASGVKLDVRRPDGTPVRDFGIALRRSNATSARPLRALGQPAPADGVERGFVSGDCELLLEGPNELSALVDLSGLAVGELREIAVVLVPPIVQTGSVLTSDGVAAPGVRVEVTWGRAAGHGKANHYASIATSSGQFSVGQRDFTVPCDAEGRFETPPLPAGFWTLRAVGGPWLYCDRTVEVSGRPQEPVTLTLPPSRSLAGRLSLPADLPLEDVWLSFQFDAHTRAEQRILEMAFEPLPLGSDASFEFDAVPIGAGSLMVQYPSRGGGVARGSERTRGAFAAGEPGSRLELEVAVKRR